MKSREKVREGSTGCDNEVFRSETPLLNCRSSSAPAPLTVLTRFADKAPGRDETRKRLKRREQSTVLL
jgi:hypothetical protein